MPIFGPAGNIGFPFYALHTDEVAQYKKLGFPRDRETIIKTPGCEIIRTCGMEISGDTFASLEEALRSLWTEENKDFIIFRIFERTDMGGLFKKYYIGTTIQSDLTIKLWSNYPYRKYCKPVAFYAIPLGLFYNEEFKHLTFRVPAIAEFFPGKRY